jgi:hypothetical protein
VIRCAFKVFVSVGLASAMIPSGGNASQVHTLSVSAIVLLLLMMMLLLLLFYPIDVIAQILIDNLYHNVRTKFIHESIIDMLEIMLVLSTVYFIENKNIIRGKGKNKITISFKM